ncbi:EthD family reductase [uncultured Halopseudomonas sp.]|mgnify:FL=1|uniref:EthD family reductase n=1 Tax=uncultured Halopseudomonas sp. TaxID=2901193 RepID=UPI0030EBF30A|tara:strand:- start:14777 stop:15088 length:312 start_codon:yes stop_codon:yes gene_type:complete
MIKASVMYPNNPNARFDMTYYLNTHMPMVTGALGAACLKAEIEKGVAGGTPGAEAPFVAIANLYFDSLESFQQAFAPNAKKFAEDIPNYTDINAQVQISEIQG